MTDDNAQTDAQLQPLGQERKIGWIPGCLGLFLFFIITLKILEVMGGWIWWHVIGVTVIFFIVQARRHNIKKSTVVAIIVGITAALINFSGAIQKPLMFDHNKPQRNDLTVMRELFQTHELPSSFKISKVRWHGVDWFPSQGLRTSQYEIEVNARDLKQLLSNVSSRMKPVEPDLIDFHFVMDRSLFDSIMDDYYAHAGKYQWKQFELESKDKLKTIRWTSDLGWDEKTSPTVELYIQVVPQYQ